jgi:Leucine-rich repeat (LRR) protein
LSNNGLTELPQDFGLLENLKKIDLSSNELTSLPTSFYRLKELQWLDLKGNPIQTLLPDIVGDCLEPKDCKQCAKNVSVKLHQNLHCNTHITFEFELLHTV